MAKPRTINVYGFGSRFERRFGKALRAIGFGIEVAESEQPPNGSSFIVVSSLDGEPGLLPQADNQDQAQRTLLISDEPVPQDMTKPRVVLPEDVSAEVLLFYLCSLMPAAERRQDERYLASHSVLYRTGTIDTELGKPMIRSELSNLSLGGAFIRSLQPPQVGTPVQLELEISDDYPPFVINGRVVYQVVANLEKGIVHNPADPDRPLAAHPGFAVAFNGSSFETRSLLQRLLRQLQESQSLREDPDQ